MNQALFIISLQHELAMAVGNKLDLTAMLKIFLKVCFNRLNLTSAHIYINIDTNGHIFTTDPEQSHGYQHLLSIPKKKRDKPWHTNLVLTDFAAQLHSSQQNLSLACENGSFLSGFIIPHHGLLVFETRFAFESEIQKALVPILNKLASSCYSSITHEALLQEVYSRQLAEDKIVFQAQHDDLTGLYNRQHLNELLAQSIQKSTAEQYTGCLFFIDLNHFKPINDSMGHSVGDKILITLANRLHSLSSNNIDIARFGGDDFIMLFNNLNEDYAEAIANIIEKLNQLLAIPFVIGSNSYKLSCSIGYTLFPQQSSTTNNIIKFAGIAMYEAKNKKITTGLQYNKIMSEKINNRLAYAEEMKHALIKNDFQRYYQPQYNHYGEVIGAEALLRWHHPIRGMESPAIYIPIAEESDLILTIGQWVLEQACRDIQQLEKLQLPASFEKVAINISAKQLEQTDFLDKVLLTIKRSNICSNNLAIELTENLLVENIETTIELIETLKRRQIDCSIDDFGTGYSSLAYLKRIPASKLKIDRSFVTNIEKSSESIAIVNMIISLAAALNMSVLAEGVETQEELNCLKMLGCYSYQGFYFSKPIPFKQLVKLLT